MRILHFGAGKIGRGLIYPFFKENHDITLVDSNVDLVQSIKDNNGYSLIEIDYESQTVIKIVNPSIVPIAELGQINEIDAITTSVLVSNLADVTPYICEVAQRNKRPLYIIPMENSFAATDTLMQGVKNGLENSDGIFFLGSVIDRIVPATRNILEIECEKYYSIKIQNQYSFGDVLNEEGVLTDDIQKEFDKKFIIVNGLHACAAYLGYLNGHEYICDVMKDEMIRPKLKLIGECYIQYLTSVYNFRQDELITYLDSTFYRFSNPRIMDPLSRVGNNLLIKLSPGDRILRPLLYNRSKGLSYAPLIEVANAAKLFKIASDYKEYLSYLNDRKRNVDF